MVSDCKATNWIRITKGRRRWSGDLGVGKRKSEILQSAQNTTGRVPSLISQPLFCLNPRHPSSLQVTSVTAGNDKFPGSLIIILLSQMCDNKIGLMEIFKF